MRFDRCKKLFSDFEKIEKLNILICGVGGVGGYALDCLYKSGIQNLTIIDFDIFDETNQNRQIGSEFVGEKKTEVLKKLYPNIKAIDKKLDKEFIENFDFSEFDFVIDAIDDMEAKIALIMKNHKKIISSMGAAKRVDPTLINIDSIWKTTIDPFAKKIRDRLKKESFKEDFRAVYSSEKPIQCEMGSFVAVTGAFGFGLCSEVLKRYI
jgi:tRNA A37 threonylcarbamoyladenosine dehydratase